MLMSRLSVSVGPTEYSPNDQDPAPDAARWSKRELRDAASWRRLSSTGLDRTQGAFATIRRGAVASPPAGTHAERHALEGCCPSQSVQLLRASRRPRARSERAPQLSDGVRSW